MDVFDVQDRNLLPPELGALDDDQIALVRNVEPEHADRIVLNVATHLGLAESLEIQAALAGVLGHRHQVGKHFMTVNPRSEYQFIPPHSEGGTFTALKLAAFLCHANTTDGGATALMNVNPESEKWEGMRELLMRGKMRGGALSPRDAWLAKVRYKLMMPGGEPKADDVILKEYESDIRDLTLLDVLAPLERTYCEIQRRELHSLWDSVGRIECGIGREFEELLRKHDLLREPRVRSDIQLDYDAQSRVWDSGSSLTELFRSMVIVNLSPGDLLVQNNLTWAHGVSNWTPGSGVRDVAAAFA